LLIIFKGTFSSVSKDKNMKLNNEILVITNQGFLTFLLLKEGFGSGSRSRSGSGSIQKVTDPDPGGPKEYGPYGSGSTILTSRA
jgi:hypothetical protein